MSAAANRALVKTKKRKKTARKLNVGGMGNKRGRHATRAPLLVAAVNVEEAKEQTCWGSWPYRGDWIGGTRLLTPKPPLWRSRMGYLPLQPHLVITATSLQAPVPDAPPMQLPIRAIDSAASAPQSDIRLCLISLTRSEWSSTALHCTALQLSALSDPT